MKTSDDLFQLIKSLSKSEKRYFKLFAALYGGEKKYLQLFEAIDAQKSYDEAKLREQFRNERFIKQLSAAKRYLREQILRSLRVYHGGRSMRWQFRDMLENLELLYERGLIEQARWEYEAAEKLAREQENHVALMSLYSWSEKLAPKKWQSGEDLSGIYGPIREAIEKHLNYIDHSEAGRYLMLPLLGDHPRTREQLDALDLAVSMLPEEKLSTWAAIVNSACLAIYHRARQEPDQALMHAEEVVRLMEDHPALLLSDPLFYVTAVGNYMIHLYSVGRDDDFWKTVERLRATAQKFLAKNMALSERVRAQIFLSVYGNEMNYVIKARSVERYAAAAAQVEQGMRPHIPYLNTDMVLKMYHQLSLLHLGMGKYGRALDFNNLVTKDGPPTRGWLVYYHARLVNLVIHYEMGHYDLLEYLVRSTYRFFRSRNIIYRFEEVVLDFFRKLLRVKGERTEMVTLFEEARCRFAELAEDTLEAHAFDYFDYVGWLDEKIKGWRG